VTTLWIGVGGAVGSMLRYHLGAIIHARLGDHFPYGTLVINVVGSFLLALLCALGLRGELMGPGLRLALGTGVLGGFTTYSTFNYDTLRLFQTGAPLLGALNLAATVTLSLIAGLLGWHCGEWSSSGNIGN
jgi:fluoride exporter